MTIHDLIPDQQHGSVRYHLYEAHEEIAHIAYAIYQKMGSPDGDDVQHWLSAEAQLKNKHNPLKFGFGVR